ncbi:VOC family protein [Sediminibacterium goheungense]|uniref:Glyoxalase-like protein n=1 Tax=Sediminibacterium goheungense TaxID=1086393 RepID=A0A4R6IWY7_9BACT|nr:VOC family protein [Sediminibacterium goheungense]TDO26496.1 glyoxalase-like protein [Sediminibacterium goheungense]
MLLTLDTVLLFVSDISKMKQFYHEVFGLSILEEIPGEWVLLSAGTVKIGLHKIGEGYTSITVHTSIETNTKLIFETAENIESLHAMFNAKNITVQNITSFDQYPYRLFMGNDPEGNVFQVMQKK